MNTERDRENEREGANSDVMLLPGLGGHCRQVSCISAAPAQ